MDFFVKTALPPREAVIFDGQIFDAYTMMKKTIMAMCAAGILAGCSDKTTDIDTRVNELYDRMTQEERIMRLRSGFMDPLFDEEGNLDPKKYEQLIPNGMGHFCQFASQKPLDPDQLRDRVAAVQDWIIHNTPSGIPALFHEEVRQESYVGHERRHRCGLP